MRFDEPLTDEQVLHARSLSHNSASVERAELVAAAREFATGGRRFNTGD
jgi:hypothetical protein